MLMFYLNIHTPTEYLDYFLSFHMLYLGFEIIYCIPTEVLDIVLLCLMLYLDVLLILTNPILDQDWIR